MPSWYFAGPEGNQRVLSVQDPATIAWVNEVVSAGGTVSNGQQARVDTLIKSLKSNGIFSIWDGFWLFASENTHQAQIDIVNLKSWKYSGTPALSTQFTANVGIAGDGSTVSLDSGINLSTAVNFSQNSGTIGCYINTADTSGHDLMGATTGTTGESILFTSTTTLTGGVNDTAGGESTITGGGTPGLLLDSRTGSAANADKLFAFSSVVPGGTTHSNGTSISTAPLNLTCWFLGANGASSWTTATLSAGFVGAGLAVTPALNLGSVLNVYMTALGVNKY